MRTISTTITARALASPPLPITLRRLDMPRSLIAIALATAAGQAQTTPRAAIRPLGAVIAKAPVTFDTLINVRGLSDGRILVNDAVGFKLVALDPTFTKATVWSDTTANAKRN